MCRYGLRIDAMRLLLRFPRSTANRSREFVFDEREKIKRPVSNPQSKLFRIWKYRMGQSLSDGRSKEKENMSSEGFRSFQPLATVTNGMGWYINYVQIIGLVAISTNRFSAIVLPVWYQKVSLFIVIAKFVLHRTFFFYSHNDISLSHCHLLLVQSCFVRYVAGIFLIIFTTSMFLPQSAVAYLTMGGGDGAGTRTRAFMTAGLSS